MNVPSLGLGSQNGAGQLQGCGGLITNRAPKPDELAILTKGLTQRLQAFQTKPEAAQQLTTFGEAKANTALNPTELAAYAVTANIILNLDEVVMH